ncbi:MAG: vWA domain-containing protein, partial [Candidatus Acidiferrales bacterium]
SVLASRSPTEHAQVFALGSGLEAMSQPIDDPRALQSAISAIQPTDSRGSFGELARGLRSFSESVQGPIELHFFSDMQKSEMPANFADLALPAKVSLILHPIVNSTVANWAVESVNAPGQVWDVKKARVQAVVAGYETPAATRTVSLVVNSKTVATRKIAVPANGRATVEFNSLAAPYGFSRCAVRIDSADSLPSDDISYFAVERSDPQQVLFLHEASDKRSPLYFGAALAASAQSAFTMESVSADQASSVQPSKYAFVVLSDVSSLPSAFENNLVRYVRGGGGVLIAAGTGIGRAPRIPLFGANILGAHYYSNGPGGYLTVGDTDPSHPSIAKADRWSDVKFYYAVKVDDSGSQVAARLTDGTPLLLDKKIGEGRVLLLASGLDNLTNDFPLHPDFVPFVEQTAFYLSGSERPGGSQLVGSYLQLRTAKERAVSVEVVDPQGRRPLSLQEATTAQTYQLNDAGFYELRLANGRRDVVGVNADRRESDLAIMSRDALSLWTGKPSGRTAPQPGAEVASSTSSVPQKFDAHSLWWYVMLLVLLTAIVESWVANLHLGVRREE